MHAQTMEWQNHPSLVPPYHHGLRQVDARKTKLALHEPQNFSVMNPNSTHKNQFDKIRILAALVVIFSHHFPLANQAAPTWLENPLLHWSMTGGVAVMTFLTISGYLVTASWLRKPQFLPFIWNRFLRIWPGLFVSVMVSVFVFGLIFTTSSAHEFLSSWMTKEFILKNISLFRSSGLLPNVYTNLRCVNCVNGVYWTIPLEFTCYLVLGVLGLIGALRYKFIANTIGVLYIATFIVFFNSDFTGLLRLWIEYPAYFVAGALIAMNQDWFSRHGKVALLIAAPLAIGLYFFTPYKGCARILLLPMLIVFIGNLPSTDNWFTRLGDPSYGIYLYGYPIAQSVLSLWPKLDFVSSMLVTFALAIAAGYASWYLVESRALRLKSIWSRHPKTKSQSSMRPGSRESAHVTDVSRL